MMYLLGVIAGAASTMQASFNGKVRESFRSPYIVTVLSFLVSIVLLSALTLILERNLYIPLGRIAEEPFWIWLGGSCGTAIIILNIVCLPRLGSARNVMIICFGQTLTGLLIDHLGMFGAPVVPMTAVRTAGAAVVIAGVALVNDMAGGRGSGVRSGSSPEVRGSGASGARSGRLPAGQRGSSPGGSEFLYMTLAFMCGFACAAQVAINGTLRTITGSPVKTTFISMLTGLITTLAVIAVITVMRGKTGIYDDGEVVRWFSGFRPWMMGGAFLAVTVVGGNAVTAPVLGTGIAAIMNLIGMMGAGLIIDATGFLGIEKKPVTVRKMAGMLLMIAGTAIISL